MQLHAPDTLVVHQQRLHARLVPENVDWHALVHAAPLECLLDAEPGGGRRAREGAKRVSECVLGTFVWWDGTTCRASVSCEVALRTNKGPTKAALWTETIEVIF